METWTKFMKFREDTWPIPGLRLLIELKEKNPVTKQGWQFYATFRGVRKEFYLILYKRRINANLVEAWKYAPVANAERFTPKKYKDAA